MPRTCRRLGDRAFAVAAPRVWNSLPTDIKVHRSTTTSFKRRLKTVLFNRGFAEYYVNDSVMHYRSFSRKCNINTLVTVTHKHQSAQKCLFLQGNLDPIWYILPWIHMSQPSKQFHHFCTAHPHNHIANLSPLVVVNGFVQPWPHLTHGSLDPHESAPKYLFPTGILGLSHSWSNGITTVVSPGPSISD